MYARGMTTRDIQGHIKEIYGADISPTMISGITDKVIAVAEEWQSCPLEKIYPIVFFDAIHYKVKEEGQIVTKAAYSCLGSTLRAKGHSRLGAWIGESEGAKLWLLVFTELKNVGLMIFYRLHGWAKRAARSAAIGLSPNRGSALCDPYDPKFVEVCAL